MPLSTIEEAIEDIRQGKMVILVDDEDRENEGDLTLAARVRHSRGDQFHGAARPRARLPEHHGREGAPAQPAADGVRQHLLLRHRLHRLHRGAPGSHAPGSPPHDRATTIRTAIAEDAGPQDLARPGHVFPIIARKGGVLVRTGQTEGSVDLARLAGCVPAGVICEVMKDDGTMARMPDLEIFAAEHGLKIVSIKQLIEYRMRSERMVRRSSGVKMPLRGAGRIHRVRLHERAQRRDPHRARQGGDPPGGAGAGPRALRMPHRRRVRVAPVRLRRAAGERPPADRGGGEGDPPLHAAGRARNRAREQDPGLPPAGRGVRHRRGEPEAGLQARPAGLRGRRADPRGPGRAEDPAPDEQPQEDHRDHRVRARSGRAGADRDGPRTRRTSGT